MNGAAFSFDGKEFFGLTFTIKFDKMKNGLFLIWT